MEQKDSNMLKSYFQTGFKPTEDNFADLIDSCVNKTDAGITINSDQKYVGIGPINTPIGTYPQERLHVEGGILLGMSENNNPGVIHWNPGLKIFQGHDGTGWKSLSEQSGGWIKNDTIIYNSDQNIGIGIATPQARFHIEGALMIGDCSEEEGQPGMLRWHTGDLQIFTNQAWRSLTDIEADDLLPEDEPAVITTTDSSLFENDVKVNGALAANGLYIGQDTQNDFWKVINDNGVFTIYDSEMNNRLSIDSDDKVYIETVTIDEDFQLRGHIKDAAGNERTTLTDEGSLYLKGKEENASLVVNSENNIGIGITSPTKPLHVQGDLLVEGGDIQATKFTAQRIKGINWAAQQKLRGSDTSNYDSFGSVAISGDWAVIGAAGESPPNNAGAVYFFKFEYGQWVQKEKHYSGNPSSSGCFGQYLAIDGDWALVCAHGESNGRVYPFHLENGEWRLKGALTVAGTQTFGHAIAMNGNWAIITDYHDHEVSTDNEVYFFKLENGNWTKKQKIELPSHRHGDHLGKAVGISENWAIIGSTNFPLHRSAAYIFKLENDEWNEKKNFEKEDTPSFGGEVAIYETEETLRIIVGDPTSKKVHIFHFQDEDWKEDELTLPYQATALASSSDKLLVACDATYFNEVRSVGIVYLFQLENGEWKEQKNFTPYDFSKRERLLANNEEGYYISDFDFCYFGRSLSISDNKALIGAPGENTTISWDGGKATNAGRTYFIDLNQVPTTLIYLKSGKVGIKNSDPFEKLDVDGLIQYKESLIQGSDERIKNIKGQSDRQIDLETLLQIEITDFTFRDQDMLGTQAQKKVIGQQVAEVFPQAIKKYVNKIPDIFQTVSIKQGWVELHAHDLQIGERICLTLDGDQTEKSYQSYTVTEAVTDRFRLDFDYTGTVFIYGREVDDFHTVDYQALSMLNVSASQALHERVQKQAQVIEKLKKALGR